MKRKAKVIKMDTKGRPAPVSRCGSKGCKVIRLPFTNLPNWDTDHKEYKRA